MCVRSWKFNKPIRFAIPAFRTNCDRILLREFNHSFSSTCAPLFCGGQRIILLGMPTRRETATHSCQSHAKGYASAAERRIRWEALRESNLD